MILTAPPETILAAIRQDHPEIDAVLENVRAKIPFIKRQIDLDDHPWQGAALYALACPYNRAGAACLEIGTAWGYSAACLASAAPLARITTLNPKEAEVPRARQHLAPWPNVNVVQAYSWDYFETADDTYDLIFVDGDHHQVERDLVWWDRLRPGGLLLFHDYAPEGAWRPCQPVFEAVNKFAAWLERDLDVLITDERQVGLAGFYKGAD